MVRHYVREEAQSAQAVPQRNAMKILTTIALLSLAAGSVAASEPAVLSVGGGKLALEIGKLAGLEKGTETDEQVVAWWSGRLGASELYVEVRYLPAEKYQLLQPEDVTWFNAANLADPNLKGDPAFAWSSTELLRGPYGSLPLAALATGPVPRAEKREGEVWVLGSIVGKGACSIYVEARPAPDEAGRASIRELLRGVRYDGAVLDPKWTDDEIRERWDGEPPKVFRTEHYVVMTDSGAGRLFAKKMEECYDAIRKVFPFEEVEARRLMPVFLFKNAWEYQAYCEETGAMTHLEAEQTKGHAWKDYYATYYDSPNDPVHIHEATHQIFRNRLFLSGGGSWFQEGVAEYMCTTRSERRSFARPLVKKGYGPGLARLMDKTQLAQFEYLAAASVIEFLRESRELKDRFPLFIERVGNLASSDRPTVLKALESVYDTDLDGLETQWTEYWKR